MMRGLAGTAWLGCFVLSAPAAAREAARVVFCEASIQACADTTRLGDLQPRGWWGAMDDGAIIAAARAGRPVPTILYPSKPAYQDAITGLRGREVAAAILRRLATVRAGTIAAAPEFMFDAVRADMQDVIRATAPEGETTIDRTLAAAVALAGGAERFEDLSPGECVINAQGAVTRLRAELTDQAAAAGYGREAERLAALLLVLRPHNAERASPADLERAYFVPGEHPPTTRDEAFADHPWYGWRGGTVLPLRASDATKPPWRQRKVRLMYFDRASFLRDITSLTDAQLNRRLSAWLSGPPPDAFASMVARLAFEHASDMRQCTAPRQADPRVSTAWTDLTKLAADNLRLVLHTAGQKRLDSRAARDRLRADAALLEVLVHAAPTPSLAVPAVDHFQTAVERLAN